MKRLSRALVLALGLVAFFSLSPAPNAEEMSLEKAASGAWSVEYAGQTFRVSSTVSVKIRFELLSPSQVKLTIVSETGQPGRATVYWVDYEKYIFSGQVPVSEPWEGTLNTEGGFIDR